MKDVRLKDLLGLPIISAVCLYERKSDSNEDIVNARLIKNKEYIPLGNISIMGYEDYRVLGISYGEDYIKITICRTTAPKVLSIQEFNKDIIEQHKQVTDDLIVYKSIGLIADVVCDLVKELKQENLNIVTKNKIEGLEKVMIRMQYKISNFSTKNRSE